MQPVRRLVVSAALVCLGTAGLTACGGGSSDGPAAESTSALPALVQGSPDTWPLTGLPVGAGKTSIHDRPVLVLKMDNTASSAPQIGLSHADMVVEELVEGGITRLAAFYYSDIPGTVGPVRSMRASDIGIVGPVGGTLVASGAAAPTIKRLHDAGVHYFNESSGAGYFRDSSRYAPYNLFTKLTDVAAAAKQDPGRPADYLPWGTDADLPRGEAATGLAATFSGGHTTDWTYEAKTSRYVNENTDAAQGDTFPADTVLVLRVREGDAGYLDPAGNHVPETKFTGTGRAMLFHGGRLVRGSWHKDALESPLTLQSGGAALKVPAGHTWIELVPDDGGSVTVSTK